MPHVSAADATLPLRLSSRKNARRHWGGVLPVAMSEFLVRLAGALRQRSRHVPD
jgi:hypothetical protein